MVCFGRYSCTFFVFYLNRQELLQLFGRVSFPDLSVETETSGLMKTPIYIRIKELYLPAM